MRKTCVSVAAAILITATSGSDARMGAMAADPTLRLVRGIAAPNWVGQITLRHGTAASPAEMVALAHALENAGWPVGERLSFDDGHGNRDRDGGDEIRFGSDASRAAAEALAAAIAHCLPGRAPRVMAAEDASKTGLEIVLAAH